jgi:hypothetical protein
VKPCEGAAQESRNLKEDGRFQEIKEFCLGGKAVVVMNGSISI